MPPVMLSTLWAWALCQPSDVIPACSKLPGPVLMQVAVSNLTRTDTSGSSGVAAVFADTSLAAPPWKVSPGKIHLRTY